MATVKELVKQYLDKKLLLDLKYGGEHMEKIPYIDEFEKIIKPLDWQLTLEQAEALELENWLGVKEQLENNNG